MPARFFALPFGLSLALAPLLAACSQDPCMTLKETCTQCSNVSIASQCASFVSAGDGAQCEMMQQSYTETCDLIGADYSVGGTDGGDGTDGTSSDGGDGGDGGGGGGTSDSGIDPGDATEN